MENNYGWLESVIYHQTDPQQQTYVTKHDLALLHKKIIATDLIVQKYQEANKALLSLQVENDHLRQQIEQITNECCIFGKQVTECTQECDYLKEQIGMLSTERRELNDRLRLVQDENTNYYHEVMVLKQYESLKDINDQSTKTIERQQKEISKLQLKLQRKSPIIYKPNSNNREPSETDVALINSQKSVRELKLALARLMNFIQVSKVEVPAALRIRPVLIAHEINDDFLEIEGEFVLRRKRRKSKPVVTPVVVPHQDENDDDDDDENGDFIDVPPISQPHPVNASAPVGDSSKNLPNSSAGEKATKKSKQKKEPTKKKKPPKSSKRKRRETEEQPAGELDDLVNDLEMAISQADQPTQSAPMSHSISFFSDEEEDESRRSQSSQPHVSQPTYQPTSLSQPIVPRTISTRQKPTSQPISTTFIRELSTLSDDETDDRRQASPPAPVPTPVIERNPTPSSIVIQRPVTRLQGRLRASNDLRTSISMLSEDDDHQPSQMSSPAAVQFYARSPSPVYDEPPPMTEPTQTTSVFSLPPVDDFSRLSSQSDMHPPSTTDSPTIDLPQQSASSVKKVVPLGTTKPYLESSESLPEKTVETIATSKAVDTLDQHHTDLVLRLLHVLRQVPPRFEPLRLSRRRSRPKKISEKKPPVEHVSAKDLPTTIETPPIISEERHVAQSEVEQQTPMEEEGVKLVEKTQVEPEQNTLMDVVFEDQQQRIDETAVEVPLTIEHLPESASVVVATPSTILNAAVKQPSDSVISAVTNASVLSPSHAAIIFRLLRVLTTLPIKPTRFPKHVPVPSRKREAPVVTKSSVPPVQPKSNRISRSPPPAVPLRMHTRSLNTIHACITRCNRPSTVSQKRTNNASVSPAAPPPPKRMRASRPEAPQDEYAPLKKFLHTFAKEINADLKTLIERKLLEDSVVFSDHLYRLINEIIMSKCDILLPLVKHLHPCEESLKIVVTYINSKSTVFQQYFLHQSRQTFEHEIQEKKVSDKRIKVLNRLFFLTCSTFSPVSPVIIYARLFDLGYSSSREVLLDALLFVQHACPTLLPITPEPQSANRLLHRVLFEIFSQASMHPSLEYLENLRASCSNTAEDREDLLRSFLLICRHQPWTWCSGEVCTKLLLPLVTRVDQRLTILFLLQHLLFVFKDNDQFRRDAALHHQVKQALQAPTMNANDESIVRDKILFILQTYTPINT